MRNFILTAGLVFFAGMVSFAQNEEDALRYSNISIMGTARYAGLSGAYGAVGADFTSLSGNPAGIGLYKKSDFSITPSIYFGNSNSSYNGIGMDDGRNNFALGNAGIVLAMKPNDRLDRLPVENYQFGFGINRLKDFNNREQMQGINDQNSLLDAYLDYSNGLNPEMLNGFDTRLAFDTYLIDTIPGADDFIYIDAYDYLGGFTSTLQRKSIETKGSMNEWVLSGGMNISDQIYFGATLGFPYIRYYRTSTYSEINQNPEKDLKEFSLRESLETKGSGFNIKVGAIAKVMPWLRLGLAYHSPSWFNNMHDSWNSGIDAYYANGDRFSADSPYGNYEYDLQTPWRTIASAAFIIGNRGLVSADYEYVDYSKAKLRAGDYNFYDENDAISSSYTNAGNLRLGAEWRFDMLQVRGGYSNYGSPFKTGINDAKMQSLSGGLGFRSDAFYMDASFSYSQSSSDYFLYGTENVVVNPVKQDFNYYNLMFTFGYRFE